MERAHRIRTIDTHDEGYYYTPEVQVATTGLYLKTTTHLLHPEALSKKACPSELRFGMGSSDPPIRLGHIRSSFDQVEITRQDECASEFAEHSTSTTTRLYYRR